MATETVPSPPGRVRVGLVGAGGIATVAHLPTLRSLESRVEVVGITDLDADRVTQVADEWVSRGATTQSTTCSLPKNRTC